MQNEQPVPVSSRLSSVEFAFLPRKRLRAIGGPSAAAKPTAGFAPAPSPFVPQVATPLPAGTVTSCHVGRLKAEPTLNALPARVRKGQRMAVVQALGTAHEVQAPYDGVVLELLTPCGEAIEYGQPVLRMALPT